MAFYIEHRIGVSAPAEAVWAVVSDIGGWPSWTGMYSQASGVLRIGEALALTLSLPGEAPMALRSTVLDWTPDGQIHLRTKLLGGLLTTTRYLEIEPLSAAGCIFANGEIFSGPLIRFMPRKLRYTIRRALEDMSEGLKAKAEAAWEAQRASLTARP